MVISNLPKAGLGNKLFVWAHGLILADVLKTKHITIGWRQVMIGPILRGEKSWRQYARFFKRQNRIKLLNARLNLKRSTQLEPKQSCNDITLLSKNANYNFSQVPHWSNYFECIINNRQLVIDAFFKMLNTKYLNAHNNQPSPVVSFHIRMGDFRKIDTTKHFKDQGAVRTPLSYFLNIASDLGTAVPITVFTDGNQTELNELSALPNVKFSNNNNDLLDLLQMSKSKMIILSAGSTFGQWAGFLSNAIIIHHPDHYHSNVRNIENTTYPYEGIWAAALTKQLN
jgi:hypothetical protein